MSTKATQIITRTIVYSTVSSGADQIKHQNSDSLAFVRGIHRWPVQEYKQNCIRPVLVVEGTLGIWNQNKCYNLLSIL